MSGGLIYVSMAQNPCHGGVTVTRGLDFIGPITDWRDLINALGMGCKVRCTSNGDQPAGVLDTELVRGEEDCAG
jgi:hypothetical protein